MEQVKHPRHLHMREHLCGIGHKQLLTSKHEHEEGEEEEWGGGEDEPMKLQT